MKGVSDYTITTGVMINLLKRAEIIPPDAQFMHGFYDESRLRFRVRVASDKVPETVDGAPPYCNIDWVRE